MAVRRTMRSWSLPTTRHVGEASRRKLAGTTMRAWDEGSADGRQQAGMGPGGAGPQRPWTPRSGALQAAAGPRTARAGGPSQGGRGAARARGFARPGVHRPGRRGPGPEFGAQTKKAADSLSDALSATFAEVSERFRSKPGGG